MSLDENVISVRQTRPAWVVLAAGAAVGVLGGMIGLRGAEFRLPLLIGLFGFTALSAVILNAMSLIVVLTALPARLATVTVADLGAHWAVAVNLLAGSLLGAWAGASWAVRMRTATLHKVPAALIVLMAAALVLTQTTSLGTLNLPPAVQAVVGVAAGFGIGVVAAIMGVAGGELLIPTIVLLYGIDIKTARAASRCWFPCPPCSSRSLATAVTTASASCGRTFASPPSWSSARSPVPCSGLAARDRSRPGAGPRTRHHPAGVSGEDRSSPLNTPQRISRAARRPVPRIRRPISS